MKILKLDQMFRCLYLIIVMFGFFFMVIGYYERRKFFWKIKEYGLLEEKLIRFVRVCLNDYI